MRLQQNIFLWIAVSAILPLTIVILALTLYGERLYRQQVAQEISASLSNISTDMERSLAYERSIVLRIASSFAMRQYLPVLGGARSGEMHAEFNARTDRLNRFLLSFHDILLGQGTFRVLDLKGNTMVKVGFGRITPPSFDGFESFPYAEQERGLIGDILPGEPEDLKPAEVNFLTLVGSAENRPLLDGVVPLIHEGERVGYLVSSLTGLQLDYILQLAPRPYHGKLSVIEINPDAPARHGRILYDEARPRLLAESIDSVATASTALMSAIQEFPDGALVDSNGRTTTYYSETFPYPDRLLSWVIAMQVDDKTVARPFQQLRWGILIFSILLLAVSLLVAQFAAGKVARPLALLIENFHAMSKGEHTRSLPRMQMEELNELSKAFNEMQENLGSAEEERDRARDMMIQNAKLASIGQLAAGIGHELNNPLNNILSYASLIRREADSDAEAVCKDIEALRDEAERASKIVQGILGFSRQMPASFTEFPVLAWLQQSIDLVQATALKKSVDIRLHGSEDYRINADRGLLQQALINLLINAIQASPQNATVDVFAQKQNSHHLIRVEDAGKGIDDDALEHLFEPFFTTKDVGEGSGLGLSITLGIVEQHQGALQLENRYNENDGVIGVSATMALPITMEEDKA
ncbi:MAG: HAMP domain-containing histidine kinase [Gammaproteobacteria bacterium]|nr:HAMP domain-containing histidine kinase [Gammaproteobacteria bacterium]